MGAVFNKFDEGPMNRIIRLAASLMLGVAVGLSWIVRAQAQGLTIDQGRAAVASFYDALNEPAKKDVAALVTDATTADWLSCGGNESCYSRDQVIAAIVARGKTVPDLKWRIVDLLVSGNQVIVRGEATGTPSGPFMGVQPAGKSFRLMSIDVHTIANGKMVRSYHVEDWMGAVRQLAAN
jgi:predicted ester cyclase